MKIIIETNRLIIRELLPSDSEGIFALDSDPEVHKYLGNNPLTTKEQASEVIEFIRKQYFENGIGRWAMIYKECNEFVGWTGFKFVTEPINDHKNYCDIGYRLVKKHWGKGFATESALACLKYAFETLKVKEVCAFAEYEHEVSNHILTKIGLKFVETFDYEGKPHNWYQLERNEYLKKSFA